MKKILVYGIIVLVAISPLFRGLFFNYEIYGFLAALSLLAFLYYLIKIKNNEPVYTNKVYLIIGMMLVAANILGFINAVNPRENLGSVLFYTGLLIVFHVLFDYFHGEKQMFQKILMLAVVPVGFICGIIGLEALNGSFGFLDVTIFNHRLGSTFQYTNTASIYFTICILFSLTLAITLKSAIGAAIFAGAGNILIFALFMTVSRGGYLIAAAVTLLFMLFQPAGHRRKGILGLISMLLPLIFTVGRFNASSSAHDYVFSSVLLAVSFLSSFVLFLLFNLADKFFNRVILKNRSLSLPGGSGVIFFTVFALAIILAFIFRDKLISLLPQLLVSRFSNLNLNDPNILFRLEFDKDALKLISDHWLFGLGGGGWQAMYQSVQDLFYTAASAHNSYLQIFVEAGILGFLSYLALVVFTLAYTVMAIIKTKDKPTKVYSVSILCGFLALAVHSSFDFDLSYLSLVLLFWVMSAAALAWPEAGTYMSEVSVHKPAFIEKCILNSNQILHKMLPVVVSAVLFSMYSLFFTGSYNEREGQKHMQAKDYSSSVVYYEEASRFDPENAAYLFELSKLYYHFAQINKNIHERNDWLQKAIEAGERSISLNRNYPPQLQVLVQAYSDQNMPLKSLECAQSLVSAQRYNSANYELLAKAYLEAALHYKEISDIPKEKEVLTQCIEIKENTCLLRSNRSIDMIRTKEESNYTLSYALSEYLNEASEMLEALGKNN